MKVRLCWGQLLKRISVCVAGLFSVQRSGECARTFAFEPLEPRLTLAGGLVEVGAQPSGSLSGKVVFAAAGHGWQWNSALNRWATDRGNLLSIVEDFGNQDQLTYYVDYLHRSGATVVPMRPVGRQLNEAVLDNDSPEVTFSGAWTNNTAGPRWYDEDYGAEVDPIKYRFASVNSQSETATATYAPNLPATGFYPVYTWVSHSPNRTNQLYKINHSGGTTEVRVDHRNVGNGWVYLGMYHFEAGRSNERGSVQISNRSSFGGSVVIADAIRFGNGMGDLPWNNSGIGNGNISGYPREDEGSILWAWRGVGQGTRFSTPQSIVGTSNVSAPLRFAAEMHAPAAPYGTSVYVSFHSNATTGNPATATARGAIGLISSSSPTPNQAALALFMGRQLNVDMRALNGNFEHDWSTRTNNTLSGGFGEISNSWAANRFDATIVEVGFHDNTLDAELLRDSKVRQQLGRSTYEATLEHLFTHFGTTSRPANVTVPSSPLDVRVTSTEAGSVSLRWNPGLQSTGGFSGVHGSPATGYRIYASTNGYGFDGGTYVPGGTTSVSLAGYDPDVAYFFKIVAENTGGQSHPSEVLAVTPNGGDRQVLIVNGFDRIDRSQNFKQPYAFGGTTTDRVWQRYGNSRDYMVPLQQAIQAARPGVRVDSTSNEAVINGSVELSQYQAVIWLLGTESVVDQTFSPNEQTRVNQFVSGGGHLLVTGSEVAFDLDLLNNGRTFFRNTLGASYVADSSSSYVATPIVGGIFAGMNSFSFSNGAAFSSLVGQTYNVASADVINPQAGAASALRYGASGGVAAIQKPGTQGRGNVVTFGFPIETIIEEQTRVQVIDRVLEFFEISPVVAVPPKVVDVIVASSSWSAAMIDAVDGQATGAGNGLGLSLVGADQLVNLLWTGIDRIYIRFDQNVETAFVPSNVTLRGTNVQDYLPGVQLTYGQAGANVGTIMLASPLGNDALLLTLFDSITGPDGQALDGEWVDVVSLVSGDGMAGGAFHFRIDSLPGDVNDNGGVNTADVLAVNAQRGQLTTDLATARFDINGNGGINTADVLAVNAQRGTILPVAPLPLSAVTQSLVLSTPLSTSGLLHDETAVSATQVFAARSVVSSMIAGDTLEEASRRFSQRVAIRERLEFAAIRKPTPSSPVAFLAARARATIPTPDAKSNSLLEGESSDAKLEGLAKASASQRSSLRRFRR